MINCPRHNSKVRRFRSEKGFTLLELIVVFTIIAILSTMGIASFMTYSRNQTLVQAAQSLENTIHLARSDALSQVKPSVCTGQVLNGYQIDINTLNNTYSLSVVCNGTHVVSQTTLPTTISFSSQTTATSIFYPIISSGATGGNTKIVLTGYGNNFTINIDNNGNLY